MQFVLLATRLLFGALASTVDLVASDALHPPQSMEPQPVLEE